MLTVHHQLDDFVFQPVDEVIKVQQCYNSHIIPWVVGYQ